ncbi:hypothetical protein CRG98_041857 [Punica granatum]|uniref:Uncharacterized protein n=1 Tax=Punica granatum TaxID=22663 RepID=A0A2I0I1Z2_PUNGR|nr:hypothetical protein CRG98_041857 [Punica granatum]
MAAFTSFGTTSPRYIKRQAMYFPCLGSHLAIVLEGSNKKHRLNRSKDVSKEQHKNREIEGETRAMVASAATSQTRPSATSNVVGDQEKGRVPTGREIWNFSKVIVGDGDPVGESLPD